MSIEEAYQKAKEAGYSGRLYSGHGELLDPDFWRCLGKSLGWKPVINPAVIGGKIRQARIEAGLRQDDLGKQLGYSAMGISHFEKGTRMLKVSTVQKLAEFFKKDASYFVVMEEQYLTNWHSFIDHLDSRKTAEDFFNSLR